MGKSIKKIFFDKAIKMTQDAFFEDLKEISVNEEDKAKILECLIRKKWINKIGEDSFKINDFEGDLDSQFKKNEQEVKTILNRYVNPFYFKDSKDKEITGLSKINIFVGANNTGKSRFLRTLASFYPMEFEAEDFKEIKEKLESFKEKSSNTIEEIAQEKQIVDIGGIKRSLESIFFDKRVITEDKQIVINLKEFIDKVNELKDKTNTRCSFKGGDKDIEVDPFIKGKLEEVINSFSKCKHILDNNYRNFTKIYIPSLRGLRTLDFKNDLYKIRTVEDYEILNSDKVEVFTGQSLYGHIRNLLLGDRKKRDKLKAFEDFLSGYFFNGQEVVLVPREKDNMLWVYLNGEEHKICDLGDGIQSIIILTFPLFENIDKNAFVFIEEPEMYLHPGFQRIFMNLLCDDKFIKHQYFIATHSNNLIDMTLEHSNISIYTFHKIKQAKFEIKKVECGDFYPLKLLGAKNSSVFLSNCTVWVEGITDIKYIRKYLDIYQKRMKEVKGKEFKEYQEDMHYSFVEYCGSNIVHCLEEDIKIKNLCGKAFCVADRDDLLVDKEKLKNKLKYNDKKVEKLIKKLEENNYIRKGKSKQNVIANKFLTLEQAEDMVLEKYNKEEIFKVFKQAKPQKEKQHNAIKNKFGKGNTHILKCVTIENTLPIGILKEIGLINLSNSEEYYSKINLFEGKGASVKKNEYCEKAIEKIKELTEEAKKLAERIYKFIDENNNK